MSYENIDEKLIEKYIFLSLFRVHSNICYANYADQKLQCVVLLQVTINGGIRHELNG